MVRMSSLPRMVTTSRCRWIWIDSPQTRVCTELRVHAGGAVVLMLSAEARDDLIRRVSLMKRNVMAAPFEHAFNEHHVLKEEAAKFTSEEAPQGVAEGGEVKAIHYRDEEAIYLKASHDRVTVIFSTIFREETDRVFGKVLLPEFVDARRGAIQNAPQVLFRTDPPLELQNVPGVRDTGRGEIGYVTFGGWSELDLLFLPG